MSSNWRCTDSVEQLLAAEEAYLPASDRLTEFDILIHYKDEEHLRLCGLGHATDRGR